MTSARRRLVSSCALITLAAAMGALPLAAQGLLPPKIVASNVTNSFFSLTWSPVAGATFYVIYYSPDGTFPAATTKMVNVQGTGFNVTGLNPGTKIYFYGKSGNQTSFSAYSAVGTAVTTYSTPVPQTTPVSAKPPPPSISATNITMYSITLVWNPVPNVTAYSIVTSTNGSLSNIPPVTVSGTSYTVRLLMPGQLVLFTGQSCKPFVGCGEWSPTQSVRTVSATPTPIPCSNNPTVPLNGSVRQTSATTLTATVSWWRQQGGPCHYKVIQSPAFSSPGVPPVVYTVPVVNQYEPEISYTLTNLAPAMQYKVEVIGYSRCDSQSCPPVAGTGETVLVETAKVDTPLAEPTNITAVKGATDIKVSWTASSGATSYNVVYTKTYGSGYLPGCSTTGTTCTIANLTPGTTYYVGVYAIGPSGQSNMSQITTGTSKVLY